jgi:cytochrome c5
MELLDLSFKVLKGRISILVLPIALSLWLASCTYENELELYPEIAGCDTANVTYSGDISQIVSANCNVCHSGSAPPSNVRTDNYEDLKIVAENGLLLNVVNHAAGFPAMPKDKPKLSDCDILKITIWVQDGALNN